MEEEEEEKEEELSKPAGLPTVLEWGASEQQPHATPVISALPSDCRLVIRTGLENGPE